MCDIICETDQPDLAAELRAVRQEFADLQAHTDKITGHDILYQFYIDKVKPVEQRYDLALKQARMVANKKLRQQLQVPDGFSSEILYHGSNAEFVKFDRSKGRTAEHIYTTPDIETAKTYGVHLYQLFGRQKPQADISADTSDYNLLRRIHRHGQFKQSYGLSLAALSELIADGQLYQSQGGSGLQDSLIDTCFALRFRSVRMSDPAPGGGFSDSVIFDHADDLVIVKRLS